MQCSPPLCGTGYPNLGQFYCYNPSFSQHNVYPEIIGEGEVASVVFPDGSIHLYFIPLNKRFPPTCQPNPGYNPYFNSNIGAYYVRSISNPISSAVFNQQCQQMYAGRLPRPCFVSDCNMNMPSPGFQLKFHNDCWTSTTDLHYFWPRLRRCELFPVTEPKGCASVQVDIPVKEIKLCNQEVTCARPCVCSLSDNDSGSGNETIDCYCDKVVSSRRSKSCVASKQVSKKRVSWKKNKYNVKSKGSNVVCECKEAAPTTDKCVATYTEQASSCADSERDTQTSRSCAAATSARGVNSPCNRSEVKTELWCPKMSQDEQLLKAKSSEKIVGIFETSCSSASCCCSTTDTDAPNA